MGEGGQGGGPPRGGGEAAAPEAPQQTAPEELAVGPVVEGAGSGGKGGGGMGGVDGGSGLLRSRSRSRGSFRPGQRQPDSTLREAQLQAAARRLLAGGLTGQLLRLAAAELGSSAWEKADEIAAIMEAGSQRAAPSGCSPRTAGTEPRCFVRLPSQRELWEVVDAKAEIED